MFKQLLRLPPRQRATLSGAALGLTVMVAQQWLPKAFSYRFFRSAFINGVGLGVGIGGGFALATSALTVYADVATGRAAARSTTSAMSGPSAGAHEVPADLDALEQEAAFRQEARQQRRAALAVGGLTAVIVMASARTALALRPDFTLLRRLRASGVKHATPARLNTLRRQTTLGLSLGAGLLLAASALNWMIEEFDSILGEEAL